MPPLLVAPGPLFRGRPRLRAEQGETLPDTCRRKVNATRWLEVSVVASPEVAEVVNEIFNRLNPGPDGRGGAVIEISGFDPVGEAHTLQATVRTYVPDTPEGRARLTHIEEALGYLNAILPVPEPAVRPLGEEDWAEAWKAHYKPLRVGERLLIVPAWERDVPTQPEDVVVRLEPGMAFGTGLHPSTRLALCLLEQTVWPGTRVLDVGTGSGILAIAAALLGATEVVATDVDEYAVRVARENVRRNRVETAVRVYPGSLPGGEAPFDLVVVNILPDTVLSLLREGLWDQVRTKGTLLLSGIVLPREAEIVAAVKARGGRVTVRVQEEDWVGLQVIRP